MNFNDLDDLHGVCQKAILGCLERYDTEKGDFTSFLNVSIKGAVSRFHRDQFLQSTGLKRRDYEINAWLLQFHSRGLPEEDAVKFAAENQGVSGDEVYRIVRAVDSAIKPRSIDDESTVGLYLVNPTQPSTEDAVLARLMDTDLHKVLKDLTLSDEEKQVLKYRYGIIVSGEDLYMDDSIEKESQSSVGLRIGISQMQVSRVERRLVERIREELMRDDAAETREVS